MESPRIQSHFMINTALLKMFRKDIEISIKYQTFCSRDFKDFMYLKFLLKKQLRIKISHFLKAGDSILKTFWSIAVNIIISGSQMNLQRLLDQRRCMTWSRPTKRG